MRLLMVCQHSLPAWMVCEFISNARWVVIRSISELTGSTLDCSSEPCCSGSHARCAPGAPVCRRARGLGFLVQVLADLQQALGVDEIGQLDGARLLQRLACGHLIGNDARRD